jgi:signal transduction histidine kinase/CheY-like chemotaxis protein
MLQYFKNEVILSVLTALVLGLVSFFVFSLPLGQSILSSVTLLGLSLFLSYIRKQDLTQKEPEINDEADNSLEEYKLLEKKFKAISQKANRVELENKTTELFLASMSHEIRTPLNGIIGLTEVLDDTPLTQEQKEFVSMIRESSNNLRVIVNDILDVSKMNAGKMELESIPFNLFSKIESSVGIFKSKIDEKDITLHISTDSKIPTMVIGDPTRLSQVIINLVSNALKFTNRGGKIDVTTKYLNLENDEVTFKVLVSDSGIGLSNEQQERIFEAYSQATASTTRKSGGTGLGLTISSKIMKSMGTELKVKSQEGKGATFYFVLTLKIDTKSLENEAKKRELEKEDSKDTHSFTNMNVLVAEDNPINQKLIKIVLENFGLSVTLTANGQEAYDARVNGNYGMIFMDIQMPVMGGVESASKIIEYEKKNNLKHIPIIALTANALPGDREKYIKEGMDDYATKPLDVKVLEKLIAQYCSICK